MGAGCSKRASLGSYQRIFRQQVQGSNAKSRINKPKTFFLDKDWEILLTPTQKFQVAVRRVIALLKIRKRTAYYFHHLKELTELAKDGKPNSQALFKELERKKGKLNREIFFRWNEGSGSWEPIQRPAKGALWTGPIVA